ncbi:hypothetical protein L6164_033577 [Bauhinia variegata]|uniref:Uncharacterized protein n=1 Tax=Bauhinia variegata TaxID=167791 RepID=A0ACB9KS38_BAUVA|nr:hypothetical protein L6164_033577 [Bauhinia variegata]
MNYSKRIDRKKFGKQVTVANLILGSTWQRSAAIRSPAQFYTTNEGISMKNRSGFDSLHIAASHGCQDSERVDILCEG